VHVATHDEEFVSTVPRDDVLDAYCVSDPVRNDPQDVVADEVTVAIIDLLEVVKVDEEDRNSVRVTCAARQRLVKLLHRNGPVRERGKWVMQCLVLHPTRAALTRSDVASDG
jgi:hypothetical protein